MSAPTSARTALSTAEAGPSTAGPLLSINGLTKHFPLKGGLFGQSRGVVRAVDGISFDVAEGETLGIVGESGCGKSTTARLLVDLISPDSGSVILGGRTLGVDLTVRDLRRQVQMVFQDSYASLNPRLTMQDAIAFGPMVNGMARDKAVALARDLLARVGLDPGRFAGRYPHELSGGQRQRVNIARALAFSPKIVVLDEAVSALDKSVEAQVLNLLADLKAELGLTYIFISHDLNVVRYMSDRVMVMYLGQVAEIGPVDALYATPAHPYSQALLAAMPSMDPDRRTMEAPLAGDPPNPINPPPGCRFHTRCRQADGVCSVTVPVLHALPQKGHLASCHLHIPGSGHTGAPPRTEMAP
jgi:peptide/nickel transport system ATP-binding protein